jgi:hypothetical protein
LIFNGLRGVVSQKTELFITIAVENLKSHMSPTEAVNENEANVLCPVHIFERGTR